MRISDWSSDVCSSDLAPTQMNERRLLERIANLDANDGGGQTSRAEVLVTSILDHLHRILNTRQGSVPVDQDFGVPDFTNLAGSFSRSEERRVGKECVRTCRTRWSP